MFFAFCARWEIDHKKIKYKEKIAKGNFGEVWLGSWLGSPVAIKTVIGTMAQDSEFIERFVLEIKLMSNLHHPNIVMFLGACLTPVASMCLLLEFCVHGNLHEWVADAEGVFRGGFYVDAVINGAGCSYRTSAHSRGYHDYSTGFRCCAAPAR